MTYIGRRDIWKSEMTRTGKQDLPAFREKTAAFYAGELSKDAYKGFSGLYGSYAQKGGKASMLRLRMTGGCVSKEKTEIYCGYDSEV